LEVTGVKIESDRFSEIFDKLPRQGPGKDECTKKAFSMLSGLPYEKESFDLIWAEGSITS